MPQSWKSGQIEGTGSRCGGPCPLLGAGSGGLGEEAAGHRRREEGAAVYHRITSSAWPTATTRHRDAERLDGSEVDHQLELRRLLHEKVQCGSTIQQPRRTKKRIRERQ